MLESQIELKKQVGIHADRFRELMPNFAKAQQELTFQAYQDGALDTKTKRMMAMTAAIVHGCRACILYQAQAALELGASVEQLLECIGVAISLGGTQAEGEAARLMLFFNEQGLV